ncbi:MAG: c-type cytochrome [Ignavibacteria bacterium]|nr:c-type cytochrome [Ignavibacteria bacterium]
MDFPIFHLDFFGDRLLIAVIAVLHVFINHGLAVGFLPIVTLMEYRGYRSKLAGLNEAEKWDNLAYKFMFFAFIVTTTIGALTGVGIWFSAALISPASIGSLIRVFFLVWFLEWIIFVLEVVFIMIYFLTWKKSNNNLKAKRNHVRTGLALGIFSWLTMAFIVGILGFMMNSGMWIENRSLISGFTNPLYIPQLAFRTPIAFVLAGSFAFLLTFIFLKEKSEFKNKVLKNISTWMFVWTPHVLAAGLYYHYMIPDLMKTNIPVAIATQQFQDWYSTLLYYLGATIIFSMIFTVWVAFKPFRVPKYAAVFPVIVILLTLGTFERVREFVRKPFVIEDYMYSNQLRLEDYGKYKTDGILKYATYTDVTEVTEDNKLIAGKNVFNITCSRCHTTQNVNSVVRKFEELLSPAGQPLDRKAMEDYIPVMDKGRYFMPPFPGNESEVDALVEYILYLQKSGDNLPGAQTTGINVSPLRQK